MGADEPINVRVARALGMQENARCPCGCSAIWKWKDNLGERYDSTPDYLHDTDFLWRVLDRNRLDVVRYSKSCEVRKCAARAIRTVGKGRTLAEAVLLWLIVAKQAGIEVKL